MLLIHLFSEIKIKLKLRIEFMVGFVRTNLVDFTVNLFLLHLISIQLLTPFLIKLDFRALLKEEIIIYFISPYFVAFQIHGLKIRAFAITQSASFL